MKLGTSVQNARKGALSEKIRLFTSPSNFGDLMPDGDEKRIREELAGDGATISLLIESGGMEGYRLLAPEPGVREG